MEKRPKQEEQYSEQETEQRVRRALRGAFKGSPTSFKAVPRKPRARRGKAAISPGESPIVAKGKPRATIKK